MKLISLQIQRNTYTFEHDGIKPNEVGGTIVFATHQENQIHLKLSDAQINAILQVVSESLVEVTTGLLDEVIAGVKFNTPVIEHTKSVTNEAAESH